MEGGAEMKKGGGRCVYERPKVGWGPERGMEEESTTEIPAFFLALSFHLCCRGGTAGGNGPTANFGGDTGEFCDGGAAACGQLPRAGPGR